MSDHEFFHFVESLVSLLPAERLQVGEGEWFHNGDRFEAYTRLCIERRGTIRWATQDGMSWNSISIDQSMEFGLASWRGDDAGLILDALDDAALMQTQTETFDTLAYGN